MNIEMGKKKIHVVKTLASVVC